MTMDTNVDVMVLKIVNAARTQHEQASLQSVMKASSTELLWAARRLAKATIELERKVAPPDEFTLLGVLAGIRQKTGVGDKPMLSELADVLARITQPKSVDIKAGAKFIQDKGWGLIESATVATGLAKFWKLTDLGE